jgi:hypothetical protein
MGDSVPQFNQFYQVNDMWDKKGRKDYSRLIFKKTEQNSEVGTGHGNKQLSAILEVKVGGWQV